MPIWQKSSSGNISVNFKNFSSSTYEKCVANANINSRAEKFCTSVTGEYPNNKHYVKTVLPQTLSNNFI